LPDCEFDIAGLPDDFAEPVIVTAAGSSGFHAPMIPSAAVRHDIWDFFDGTSPLAIDPG